MPTGCPLHWSQRPFSEQHPFICSVVHPKKETWFRPPVTIVPLWEKSRSILSYKKFCSLIHHHLCHISAISFGYSERHLSLQCKLLSREGWFGSHSNPVKVSQCMQRHTEAQSITQQTVTLYEVPQHYHIKLHHNSRGASKGRTTPRVGELEGEGMDRGDGLGGGLGGKCHNQHKPFSDNRWSCVQQLLVSFSDVSQPTIVVQGLLKRNQSQVLLCWWGATGNIFPRYCAGLSDNIASEILCASLREYC